MIHDETCHQDRLELSRVWADPWDIGPGTCRSFNSLAPSIARSVFLLLKGSAWYWRIDKDSPGGSPHPLSSSMELGRTSRVAE